jgi:hypothetical protein
LKFIRSKNEKYFITLKQHRLAFKKNICLLVPATTLFAECSSVTAGCYWIKQQHSETEYQKAIASVRRKDQNKNFKYMQNRAAN